jgi:hypothetical protein
LEEVSEERSFSLPTVMPCVEPLLRSSVFEQSCLKITA